MAETRKNAMVIGCALVGCIVTLLTCGTLIGNIQGDVRSLTSDTKALEMNMVSISSEQTNMKTKQAFLEGVVSTKLDSIQISVNKMEKQVDDLIRVP